MHVLLISTYELGRQPFGLASPATWLREAGADVHVVDLAKVLLDEALVRSAECVAFYLPMHTATRLAVPVIRRVRAINPRARMCAYGIYAPPNEELLRSLGVSHVLGGEFEADLVAVARDVSPSVGDTGEAATGVAGRRPAALPRLDFRVPDRRGLPPLDRYASLQLPGGGRRTVGYTEATRGCKHLCRHCPIVPVYEGRFRVVPIEIVLADIRQQVAVGAEHITFGDPDFFNGPRHAVGVVRALAQAFPGLTYDVTIKLEHLIAHRAHLETLKETGCVFVTSAVESIDDRVLDRLDKGHTRADFEEVLRWCRAVGLALVPTFVAFHPWMTLDDYCELVDVIADLDLIDEVAPIQFGIRLLIPAGSRLLELDDVGRLVGPFDVERLAHPWTHPDPRVDALHEEITALVGARLSAPRRTVFAAIRELAYRRANRSMPTPCEPDLTRRTDVPYLNEPWYC